MKSIHLNGRKNDGPEIHAPKYFIFPNPEWDEEIYDPRPFLELADC